MSTKSKARRPIPKAFVSYSWDDDNHKAWVRALATKLRINGVDVTLDQWHAIPGDMLPAFMESAIRESDYVLIVCTPTYRQKSDARRGGVGYEGDIITGEVITERNQRKFVPILRFGDWLASSPSWLRGKFYIDLRDLADFQSQYRLLIDTLHGKTPQPPPLGVPPDSSTAAPLPDDSRPLASIVEPAIAALAAAFSRPLVSITGLVRGALLAGLALSLFVILYLSTFQGRTSVDVKKARVEPTIARKVDSTVAALSLERERALVPRSVFKECGACPEMIVIPSGTFEMGSPESERQRNPGEGPQRRVTLARKFAVGRFSVTFEEWDACVADLACNAYRPSDQRWGRDRRPVINVSWNDAKAYVAWLSKKTAKAYRLPSEAEREYFTRAGTTTPFWWGTSITPEQANYNGNFPYDGGPKGQVRSKTVPVETFAPNPWGIHQVHGNVWEWVEDCFRANLLNAPIDGAAVTGIECSYRVLRGGSWFAGAQHLRSASRFGGPPDKRDPNRSFRLVRELSP